MARASSTDFSIHPGDSQTFIVTGSYPSIEVRQGSAQMDQPLGIGGNVWSVHISCLSSSTVDCEGTIHS